METNGPGGLELERPIFLAAEKACKNANPLPAWCLVWRLWQSFAAYLRDVVWQQYRMHTNVEEVS